MFYFHNFGGNLFAKQQKFLAKEQKFVAKVQKYGAEVAKEQNKTFLYLAYQIPRHQNAQDL